MTAVADHVVVDVPTPQTAPLPASVYEPAEDSYLMMDALQVDADVIAQCRPSLAVELGTGSGVLAAFLAAVVSRTAKHQVHIVTTDLNVDAAQCCQTTAGLNSAKDCVHPVVTDLAQCVSDRLTGVCDLVICNPPYVPTSADELLRPADPLTLSWAGGPRGRLVIDRLVPDVSRLLRPGGLFYLLLVRENDVEDVRETFSELFSDSRLIIKRQCGRELLFVVRFTK